QARRARKPQRRARLTWLTSPITATAHRVEDQAQPMVAPTTYPKRAARFTSCLSLLALAGACGAQRQADHPPTPNPEVCADGASHNGQVQGEPRGDQGASTRDAATKPPDT